MQEEPGNAQLRMFKASSFLHHFTAMMGPYGLYQHATIREPLLSEGYCTDDNTRAVQMLTRLLPLVPAADKETVLGLLLRCWKFLIEAEIKSGQFYNFRDAQGQWLTHGQSDDMYARLIRALVEVLRSGDLSDLHPQAVAMLKPLLARAHSMQALRFWGECLIALAHVPTDTIAVDVVEKITEKGKKILAHFWQVNSSPKWQWFEDTMTYANALLPHGLLSAGSSHVDLEYGTMLHTSARFLIEATIQDDMFIPIGSNGWYPRGGQPSQDNQQAIEAGTMFDFLLAYFHDFPTQVPVEVIAAPYLWFSGYNTNRVVMADETKGACLDGLFLDGPNPNHGAESMLAYLWAEILLQDAPIHIKQYIQAKKELLG